MSVKTVIRLLVYYMFADTISRLQHLNLISNVVISNYYVYCIIHFLLPVC